MQASQAVSDKSDSGSDDDTEVGSCTGTGVGVMKRWSWKANEAYFRSCCEIVESGKIMSLPQIEAELMDVWHRRLFTLSRTLALFAF
jgi:hypothetical protein